MSHPTGVRPQAQSRASYLVFRTLGTRWSDNDAYGHVNNVVYYNWFDTAVNAHLVEHGALDIHLGDTIGLVVQSSCNFFSALAFPQTVEIGMRLSRLGSSSVSYNLGVFAAGASMTAASGQFVHVYVDRHSRRPVPLPLAVKRVVEKLL